MTKEQIKKKIEKIDDQLSIIDETLASTDEVCVHELYQKEAELMKERFTLVQQYEQLIAY
jgi:predicted transcriptional regulator